MEHYKSEKLISTAYILLRVVQLRLHIQFCTSLYFFTVDQTKKMKSGYVCEILHFLLRKRCGVPLVKLTVDLVEVDNEASLDLLCALFKHCECSRA